VKALLVRVMAPSEEPMVKSDWKKDVREAHPQWGASLYLEEWWALVNHVVDTISLPTSEVWMACHRSEPEVPLAWLAVRKGEVLHRHARAAVQREPELAARLELALLEHTRGQVADWNPFLELKNHGHRKT
jgi:hypothetical protein